MNISRTLTVASLLATCGICVISLYYGVPLEISAAGLIASGVFLYLASRAPEILLVAAMFAPQWKPYWPFSIADRIVDLTLLMVACLSISIVWRMLKFRVSQEWNLQKIFFGQSHVLLSYLFFALVVTSSYSYTTAPDYGATKLLRFLLIGTLMLIAPYFLILSERDFRRFALVFVCFSLVQAFLLVTHLETRTDLNLDITSIGGGWLLGMGLILVLFYPLFPANKKLQGAVYAGALPILAVGLVASAARGAIVSAVGIIFVGAVVAIHRGRLRATTAMSLAAIFVVMGSVAFLVLSRADPGKFSSKASELEELSSGGSTAGSAGIRLGFYHAAVRAIPDHPLLGRGIGSWAPFYYGRDSRDYPHNLLLELTFEEGLLGLFAFAAIVVSVGVSIRVMLRASRYHFLVLGLLVAYCLSTAMFSGDLDDNRLIWLWAGMAMAICRLVSLRSRQRSRGRIASFVPGANPYDLSPLVVAPAESHISWSKRTRGALWN